MARHTTITIETRCLVIVQARHTCRAWCPDCSADADMIALPNGDAISGAYPALEAWLNSGDVHRCTGPEGSTLICVRSLLTRLDKPPAGDGTPSPSPHKERR